MKILAVPDGQDVGKKQQGVFAGLPRCGFAGYHNGKEAFVCANSEKDEFKRIVRLKRLLKIED